MMLDDLNPTNSFEVQLLEILRSGAVEVTAKDNSGVIATLVEKVIQQGEEIAELRNRLEAIKASIVEEIRGR